MTEDAKRPANGSTGPRLGASWLRGAALGVPALALRVFGPILDKELRVSSRRRRNYVLRGSYLLLLTVFAALAWWGGVLAQSGSPAYRQARMPEVGRTVVVTIVWFQFVALQVVAAMMLSTSVSEEVERRTLGVLMATPVRNFQIVLGKLGSKLLQLGLLVATALPLLVVVRVLGGVPWEFVVQSLAITATAVLFAGSVSLFFSTVFRQGYVAALVTLAVLLAMPLIYGFLMIIVAVLQHYTSGVLSMRTAELIGSALLCINAFLAMFVVTANLFSPGGTPIPPWIWMVHCGVMGAVSIGLVAWSAHRVRSVGMAMVTGALGRKRRRGLPTAGRTAPATLHGPGGQAAGPAGAPSPCAVDPLDVWGRVRRVRGSPLVWKELRTRLTRRRGLVIGSLVGVSAAIVTVDSVAMMLDWPAGWPTEIATIVLTVAFTGLGILGTAVPGAVGIAGERAAQTFSLLLAAPVTDAHVVAAKFLGALRRSLPAWLPLGVHLLFLAVCGRVHPVALLHVAGVAVGVLVFLTGAGLLLSACLRRTSAAVLLSVGLVLALWGLVPILSGLVGEIAGQGEDAFGACLCVHPVVQTGVAAAGAVEERSYGQRLEYEWPPPINDLGWGGSLALVAATAAGHVAAGLTMAAGAVVLLRWRA